MFEALDIGASGLQAQRTRLTTIASNVANVNTTRDAAGKLNPYRRRQVMFSVGRPDDPAAPGVRVTDIKEDMSPFQKRWEPGNPDAVKEGPDAGYVMYPNIDLTTEYVNALEASRAYEANVTMMDTTKAMINATLRLIA